jgi:hypothetical protein
MVHDTIRLGEIFNSLVLLHYSKYRVKKFEIQLAHFRQRRCANDKRIYVENIQLVEQNIHFKHWNYATKMYSRFKPNLTAIRWGRN